MGAFASRDWPGYIMHISLFIAVLLGIYQGIDDQACGRRDYSLLFRSLRSLFHAIDMKERVFEGSHKSSASRRDGPAIRYS